MPERRGENHSQHDPYEPGGDDLSYPREPLESPLDDNLSINEPEPPSELIPEPEPDPSVPSEKNSESSAYVFDAEQTIEEFQLAYGGERSEWTMEFSDPTGAMTLDPETGDMMVGTRNHTKEIYATGTAEQIAEHEELRGIMRHDVGYVHIKTFVEKKEGREFLSVIKMWITETGATAMCHAVREVASEKEEEENGDLPEVFGSSLSDYEEGKQANAPSLRPADSPFAFILERSVADDSAVAGEKIHEGKPSWFDMLLAPPAEESGQPLDVFQAFSQSTVPLRENASPEPVLSSGDTKISTTGYQEQAAAPSVNVVSGEKKSNPPQVIMVRQEARSLFPPQETQAGVSVPDASTEVVSVSTEYVHEVTSVPSLGEVHFEFLNADGAEPRSVRNTAEKKDTFVSSSPSDIHHRAKKKEHIHVPSTAVSDVSEPTPLLEVQRVIFEDIEYSKPNEIQVAEEPKVVSHQNASAPHERVLSDGVGVTSEQPIQVDAVLPLRDNERAQEVPQQIVEDDNFHEKVFASEGISLIVEQVSSVVTEKTFEGDLQVNQSFQVEQSSQLASGEANEGISARFVESDERPSEKAFAERVWQETGIGIVGASDSIPKIHVFEGTNERPVDTAPLPPPPEVRLGETPSSVHKLPFRLREKLEDVVDVEDKAPAISLLRAPTSVDLPSVEVQNKNFEDTVVGVESMAVPNTASPEVLQEVVSVLPRTSSEKDSKSTPGIQEKMNVTITSRENTSAHIRLVEKNIVRRERSTPVNVTKTPQIVRSIVRGARKEITRQRPSSLESVSPRTASQDLKEGTKPHIHAERNYRAPATVVHPLAPFAFVESLLARFRGRLPEEDIVDELGEYRQSSRGPYTQRPAPRKLAA